MSKDVVSRGSSNIKAEELLILQMGELRPKEAILLTQGHTSRQEENSLLAPGLVFSGENPCNMILDKLRESRPPQFSSLENGDGTTCPKDTFR